LRVAVSRSVPVHRVSPCLTPRSPRRNTSGPRAPPRNATEAEEL
jgi:hypothetical protein